jgi:hypothetical protein
MTKQPQPIPEEMSGKVPLISPHPPRQGPQYHTLRTVGDLWKTLHDDPETKCAAAQMEIAMAKFQLTNNITKAQVINLPLYHFFLCIRTFSVTGPLEL